MIKRMWEMPNKHTFDIKCIREFINLIDFSNKFSVDPFANKSRIATHTNDINSEYDTTVNLDALSFLKTIKSNYVDVVLYDPPYSLRQMKECYESAGIDFTFNESKASYLSNCKKEIKRILKSGGRVFCFGWNSNGIGGQEMQLDELLIVAHGGQHNDTICTLETKIQHTLF